MPGTFSPPPRVSDPDMHHGTCMTCVPWWLTIGFLWSRPRGKRSRHSRRMRNLQVYVTGKRPMNGETITTTSTCTWKGEIWLYYHDSFPQIIVNCLCLAHCSIEMVYLWSDTIIQAKPQTACLTHSIIYGMLCRQWALCRLAISGNISIFFDSTDETIKQVLPSNS